MNSDPCLLYSRICSFVAFLVSHFPFFLVSNLFHLLFLLFVLPTEVILSAILFPIKPPVASVVFELLF